MISEAPADISAEICASASGGISMRSSACAAVCGGGGTSSAAIFAGLNVFGSRVSILRGASPGIEIASQRKLAPSDFASTAVNR